MHRSETIDQSAFWSGHGLTGPPVPGLLLLFSAGEPLHGVLPLDGGQLTLGRGSIAGVTINDGRMSRAHARIQRQGDAWTVVDLESRNGTAVDGRPITGSVTGPELRIVRTGDTLYWLCPDLRPYQRARVEVTESNVSGARLRAVWEQIRSVANGGTLHVTGESGAGKELAARAFHRHGPRPDGPFVAVNCAAIPEGVAERLLFGARKGAFSGAHADVEGYVQAANGGTLFLDEVGDLDLGVQAKLLRMVETREVLALGSSRPQTVDLRICSATHKDLRELVGAKRFREDLFFRIGRPHVAIPPLRERPEEMAYLLEREVRRAAPGLLPHASLLEACLLRPWPGNVRELLVELRHAATVAQATGERVVRAAHLGPNAGLPLPTTPPPVAVGSATSGPAAAEPRALPEREQILAALHSAGGRVATAARVLGVHRTQLRRWLDKHGVDPATFSAPGAAPEAADEPSSGSDSD